MLDPERVAKIEKALDFILPKIDKMDAKLDRLIEKNAYISGKTIGITMVMAFVITTLVELFRG